MELKISLLKKNTRFKIMLAILKMLNDEEYLSECLHDYLSSSDLAHFKLALGKKFFKIFIFIIQ